MSKVTSAKDCRRRAYLNLMVCGVIHNVGPYLRPKLVNVLADAGRFTNSGSLAIFAAMRRRGHSTKRGRPIPL
jgi:hypothetical protein